MPKTIGDHILMARNERCLFQKDVAAEVGVTEAAIYNWERGRVRPSIRQLPGLIRFLGYDPWGGGPGIGERLAAYRRARGLSRRRLAVEAGLDPATIARVEEGKGRPSRKVVARLAPLLGMKGTEER